MRPTSSVWCLSLCDLRKSRIRILWNIYLCKVWLPFLFLARVQHSMNLPNFGGFNATRRLFRWWSQQLGFPCEKKPTFWYCSPYLCRWFCPGSNTFNKNPLPSWKKSSPPREANRCWGDLEISMLEWPLFHSMSRAAVDLSSSWENCPENLQGLKETLKNVCRFWRVE